jgi:hypothetical protein
VAFGSRRTALEEPPRQRLYRRCGLPVDAELGWIRPRNPGLREGTRASWSCLSRGRTPLRETVKAYEGDLPAFRFYRLATRRMKLFDERVLGGGTFVTVSVHHGRVKWEKTESSV